MKRRGCEDQEPDAPDKPDYEDVPMDRIMEDEESGEEKQPDRRRDPARPVSEVQIARSDTRAEAMNKYHPASEPKGRKPHVDRAEPRISVGINERPDHGHYRGYDEQRGEQAG